MGTIDDPTGAVLTAYTGPAVAWGMARGGPGAFGGTQINSYSVWLTFCGLFLLGLVDWRRPLSLRTVDLLMMLSFSVSLWFFNRGNIFTAMPLAYPGMAWLLVRCVWVGKRDRAPRGAAVWPVWLLVGATVFLVGFRLGLNIEDSNVIDVGLSGVIGAERISAGQDPYGNFPIEGNRPACGPADSSGEIRDRIQTNGRCEAADAQGDTYGPVSYEAYLPGYWLFGWSGKWDSLPAAHATSILWDALCLIGLWLSEGASAALDSRRRSRSRGRRGRFLSTRRCRTQRHDPAGPARVGVPVPHLARPSGRLRGARGAREVPPLIVLPLWSGYPDARDHASRRRFLLGAAGASLAAFSVLLFDGLPLHDAVVVFFHHTFGYQFGRSSPFSLWDWRQYHARGSRTSTGYSRCEVALIAGALALYRWPRRRSPLQLAAFTGALRRVRDRAHALVVALPALVFPLRRLRVARASDRGARSRVRRGRIRSRSCSSRPERGSTEARAATSAGS